MSATTSPGEHPAPAATASRSGPSKAQGTVTTRPDPSRRPTWPFAMSARTCHASVRTDGELRLGVRQRDHDRGVAADHFDGIRIGDPLLQRPGQLPSGGGVRHADQEGAVTEDPHLPVGDGACHARAGATRSIPAAARA